MSRTLPPWFDPDRWVPPPGSVERLQVSRLMRTHGIRDYPGLLARAAADPDWFHTAVLADLDLPWPVPFDKVRDEGDGVPWTRWFVGGRTNVVHLCIDRWRSGPRADQPALLWEGEDGGTRAFTFDQLGDEVARAAAGLRALGVGPGDVVAIYLPMLPEASIAMFAAARIGAIAAPAFSGYGADALAERLRLGGARVLVTADGTLRRGAPVAMKPVADAAVAEAPSVQHVVVVRRLGADVAWTPGRDLGWDELVAQPPEGPAELFDPETPFLLAFTSGSTGRPKGAVHGHGRFPYRLPVELGYCEDVRPGDRFTWVTDMGWIMGPVAVLGPPALGAATFLFEGVPDHPDPARLWRMAERHGLTHLGVSPTLVRTLAARGDEHVEPFDLTTLRVLISTGEPFTPAAWRWLHRTVGRGTRPIVNISGGTEIGVILSGCPAVPMDAGRFAGPAPGMAVAAYDDGGRPVVGEVGELVVTAAAPGMTYGFWNEPERYLESYWSRWPDVWVHGDRAIQHEDGSWELPGRSDDILKIAGKRVGPSEFESLAAEVPGVLAAAAVGLPHEVKGQVAVLLVQLRDGFDADEVTSAVQGRVAAALGRAMTPAAVLAVDELPVTRSGKVHRRAVRGWLAGDDPGDLSTLDNPSAAGAVLAARDRLPG